MTGPPKSNEHINPRIAPRSSAFAPERPLSQTVSVLLSQATGSPITHKLVSATVIAPTALEADGWDTGLMVLGTKKALALAEQQHLAVYLITKEGDTFKSYMSPQFKAYLKDPQ